MSDQAFLETILTGIMLFPQRLRIERTEDSRGILFRLHVSKPDMPHLIGKEGKSIAALRLMMKLYAKDGPNISLILEEPAQA